MPVHERYLRRLWDVLLSSRRVEIELTMRRFVCENADCEQRTFAEQVPGLTSPYGRCTGRRAERMRAHHALAHRCLGLRHPLGVSP